MSNSIYFEQQWHLLAKHLVHILQHSTTSNATSMIKFALTLFHHASHPDSIWYCCCATKTPRMISSRYDEQYTSVELLSRLHNTYPVVECPFRRRFLSRVLCGKSKKQNEYITCEKPFRWSRKLWVSWKTEVILLPLSISKRIHGVFGWIYWFHDVLLLLLLRRVEAYEISVRYETWVKDLALYDGKIVFNGLSPYSIYCLWMVTSLE